MAAISLRLPESIYEMAKTLSKQDQVSLNQFIATAVSEKVSALNTETYLNERKIRGSKEKFLSALDKVADNKPDHKDAI